MINMAMAKVFTSFYRTIQLESGGNTFKIQRDHLINDLFLKAAGECLLWYSILA